MSFEEIFNPGAAVANDQKNLDKVRPATEVVGEAPPFEGDGAIYIPGADALEPFPAPEKHEDPDDQ